MYNSYMYILNSFEKHTEINYDLFIFISMEIFNWYSFFDLFGYNV